MALIGSAGHGADNPVTSRWLLGAARRRPGGLVHKLLGLLLGSHWHAESFGRVSLPHPFGIVVNPGAVIGDLVTIHQHVTVGAAHAGGPSPRIGDRVVLGVGAVVLGDVTVGDGAVVGANAVVTGDVAPGATVVGVPARPVG